jgi:hypothetical protein
MQWEITGELHKRLKIVADKEECKFHFHRWLFK